MSEAGDALRRLADKADNEGGRAAADAMAKDGRDEIRRKLGMKSHARGTPTPSASGTPPAKVSGDLMGSVAVTPATGGGGVWTAHAGPDTVYAAIQNFGGEAGRNHASHLPPRPYLRLDAASVRISQAAASAFYREVFGG